MTEAQPLEVSIDLGGNTPPFEQIRAQTAALVHAGSLTEGDRLPTVRALAADLGVAAGTVARACSELETDGLVVGRRRFGTTITRPWPGGMLGRVPVAPTRGAGRPPSVRCAQPLLTGLPGRAEAEVSTWSTKP